MRSAARPLRLVAPAPDLRVTPARPAVSGSDELWLLGFLLAVCLVPLVGLAAGGPWGAGTTGLATAGALLSGGALVQELRRRPRTRS